MKFNYKYIYFLRNCFLGARGDGVQFIVLVYDGFPSDRYEAIKTVSNIRSNGGRIITVGVSVCI